LTKEGGVGGGGKVLIGTSKEERKKEDLKTYRNAVSHLSVSHSPVRHEIKSL